MGDDHVAIRAGRLVEPGADADVECLGDVDLHVVDVGAVPDRFEQPVGEAEGQDVECRLLAEEVVDAEDLVLGERRMECRVERPCAAEVGAERLLDDDPRPLGEAGLADGANDVVGRLRRDAEVVQPARHTVQLTLGDGDRRRQTLRTAALVDVGQLAGEGIPLLVVERLVGELVAGLARQLAEHVVVEVVERRADDPELGHQARLGQPEQARQQLAAGQVARRAEQHDHVRREGRHQRRIGVA